MAQLTFQHALWWLLPIVLLALASAWVLYRGKNQFSPQQRIFLGVLRFLLISFIGFLLLGPMLKSQTEEEEKPILVWMQDASESILLHSDSAATKEWLAQDATDLKSALAEKYQLVEVPFAKQVRPSDSTAVTGRLTNISGALQNVQNTYFNQYLGGIVLVTDGIYNRGFNPTYTAKYFDYPVHTVLLGDSTQYADVSLTNIQANDEAYLENEFVASVTVNATGLNGENSLLQLKNQEGELLQREAIRIDQNQQSFTYQFTISPKKAGLRRFSLSVTPLETEKNKTNNYGSFTINVTDAQTQVALMAIAPHPDVYALNAALSKSQRFKVNLSVGKLTTEIIDKNQVFVLHQPSADMLQAVKQSKKPYWIINGPQADATAVQSVVKLNTSGSFEPTYASYNANFTLFALPESLEEFVKQSTPLQSPFGKYPKEESSNVLFYKKIGSVVTNDPLWFLKEQNNTKIAVTQGTNLWRMRIEDFRLNNNHQLFDALIQSCVTYLSINQKEQRFTLNAEKSYSTSEVIDIKASVLNKSRQLSEQAEVSLQLTNEQNERFNYNFVQRNKGYGLSISPLAEGIYSYAAQAKLGDETFTKNGAFEVKRITEEASDLQARFAMLRSLSKQTRGESVLMEESETLGKTLNTSSRALPRAFLTTQTEPLLSYKLLFFILLTFVGIEWVLRKYLGKY